MTRTLMTLIAIDVSVKAAVLIAVIVKFNATH
jgi:hypothetical protein